MAADASTLPLLWEPPNGGADYCLGSHQENKAMRTRVIHLINPKTNSLTTRPLYFNRALYSPLAGLLAVAA